MLVPRSNGILSSAPVRRTRPEVRSAPSGQSDTTSLSVMRARGRSASVSRAALNWLPSGEVAPMPQSSFGSTLLRRSMISFASSRGRMTRTSRPCLSAGPSVIRGRRRGGCCGAPEGPRRGQRRAACPRTSLPARVRRSGCAIWFATWLCGAAFTATRRRGVRTVRSRRTLRRGSS